MHIRRNASRSLTPVARIHTHPHAHPRAEAAKPERPHEAENGRILANSNGQREDRDSCKARGFSLDAGFYGESVAAFLESPLQICREIPALAVRPNASPVEPFGLTRTAIATKPRLRPSRIVRDDERSQPHPRAHRQPQRDRIPMPLGMTCEASARPYEIAKNLLQSAAGRFPDLPSN
jgi:hypothetical protein